VYFLKIVRVLSEIPRVLSENHPGAF
jgi:hypothetical protein